MAQVRAGWIAPAGEAPADLLLNPGPLDRTWSYQHVMKTDSRWVSRIIKNLNVEPFISPPDGEEPGLTVRTASAYFALVDAHCHFLQVESPEDQEVIRLAELLGMNLPNNMALSEVEAQAAMKNCLLNQIQEVPVGTIRIPRCTQLSSLTPEGYLAIPDNVPFNGRNSTRMGLPEVWPFTADQIRALTAQQVGQTWFLIGAYPTQVRSAEIFGDWLLRLIVTGLVSVVKQGNCTEAFSAKIQRGMQQDYGKDVDISPLVISRWYQRYGAQIDDANIHRILDRWLRMIPDDATRLILTIVQAPGTGLTAFMTIADAMKSFPTFNWEMIEQMYPSDMNHFEQAITAVGQNRWYGYRKDLGEAKAANFRNLAWVAKELLIKGRGETALRGYKGWKRAIPQMLRVRWIIAQYLREPTDIERLEEWPLYERPDVREVRPAIWNILSAANNIYG